MRNIREQVHGLAPWTQQSGVAAKVLIFELDCEDPDLDCEEPELDNTLTCLCKLMGMSETVCLEGKENEFWLNLL